MFNPNNTTDFKTFWNRLSTFYDFVPKQEKVLIEVYWEQLFNGMEGLPYDLSQVGLAGYLDYAPGYIEDQYQEYDVIFSGDDKNVILETYDIPTPISVVNVSPSGDDIIYNYKITAVDDNGETLGSTSMIIISGANDLSSNANTLSWEPVSGISTYGIYGRDQNEYFHLINLGGGVTSWVDNGSLPETPDTELPTSNTTIKSYLFELPNDYPYLTIPILSGLNTSNILVEGTDYVIERLHHLRFINEVAVDSVYGEYSDEREIFIAPIALFLLPSLVNLYFKAFGGPENPEGVLNANAYTPYIDGYSSLSNFEQKKAVAVHLKHLSQGLTAALSKGPSFKNLTTAFCMISGMPFSYEAGEVSITPSGDDNIITISGGNEYFIPSPLTLSVTEGSTVERYEILASGISLHDYISSSGILEELTALNPEQFYYTLGIQRSNKTYGLDYYEPFVDYYTNSLLPAGLLANYFNLPPRGFIASGNSFYSGGAVATLSGVITDPEEDTIEYLWTHVKPLTTWDGSPSLECTIDSPTTVQTTTTLTTPPVDRYYLFRLNVSDTDNSADVDIEQNVFGDFSFTTWGQTTFQIGDAELRYTYLV